MDTKYNIFFIYDDMNDIVNILENEIQLEIKERFNDINSTYFDKSFKILHNKIKDEDINGSCIALYFGNKNGYNSKNCHSLIDKCLESSIFIIPIIKKEDNFYESISQQLQPINAFEWEGDSSKKKLTLTILENLGLSEKDRKVFISYRRADGLGMADQFLDILTRQGFDVFLDRYDVDIGRDFQEEIYNSIDDKAFLLVIESPRAYESEWISKEIHYALRNHITVMILKWFNTTISIEDSKDLRRIELKEDDLYFNNYLLLKEERINTLILEIESEHSYGLLRRRNNFIKSIEKEWKEHYNYLIYLDNWIIFFKESKNDESNKIITITPRIPQSYDLYLLDNISEMIKEPTEDIEKILFHKSQSINLKHQELLMWIIKEKLNIHIFRYIA